MPTEKMIWQVLFKPKARGVDAVRFLICDYSASAATYLAWRFFKQSGWNPRDFLTKPDVTPVNEHDATRINPR